VHESRLLDDMARRWLLCACLLICHALRAVPALLLPQLSQQRWPGRTVCPPLHALLLRLLSDGHPAVLAAVQATL
jgi:hypothetical protein